MPRHWISTLLATCAVLAFVGAINWASATFDFWETGPAVGSLLVVGGLSGLSVYVAYDRTPTRRLMVSGCVGVAAATVTFIATAVVTVGQWGA